MEKKIDGLMEIPLPQVIFLPVLIVHDVMKCEQLILLV